MKKKKRSMIASLPSTGTHREVPLGPRTNFKFTLTAIGFILLFVACQIGEFHTIHKTTVRKDDNLNHVIHKTTVRKDDNLNHDNDHLTACLQDVPECVSLPKLHQKWGYSDNSANSAKKYDQNRCCRFHPLLRDSVLEVWNVLNLWNVTAWMESGSALGIARHEGMQIPWETDADIGIVVVTTDDDDDDQHQHPKFLTHEHIKEWVEGFVALLNNGRNTTTTEYLSKNNDSNHDIPSDYSIWRYIIHRSLHQDCLQIQLKQDYFFASSANNDPDETTNVDLFGWTKDDELSYTKFGTCYHRNKDRYAKDMYPPTPCQYYGHWVRCPRDTVSYLKNYYGPTVMEEGKTHVEVYGV